MEFVWSFFHEREYAIMNSMKDTRTSNRYAVVDLEATGTGTDAKIIQIGIVLVENGEIIDSYATDINPYELLDDHIKNLTGITDQQLSQAPDFGQVASTIYDMIGDAIFVAHNVKFDANLLAEALFFEGYELLTPRVDTVELSQLFFPTFEKYSLGNLAEHLELGLDQAHTAISDAMATARLLIKIQEKIKSLPRSIVEKILDLADNLLFESRLVIDEMVPVLSENLSYDLESIHGLVLKKPEEIKSAYRLSEDFSTNIALLGLHERKKQTAFAQVVEKRLADAEKVHFIQAQAGLGKTYGYLLPLLAKSDQPLLVTVPTKLLQEQIMEKEGSKLKEIFRIPIVSLKSPKHFIKLDSYWRTLQRQDDNRLVNQFKMQVLVWLTETHTGDLDELKQKQRYQAYFDEIAHDGKLETESLFWGLDFWQRLNQQALSSRLLITNHAYFLNHLKDQDPLMDKRLVVIDEAQKFLLAAENLATASQDLTSMLQVLQSKKDRATTILDQRLYESCQFELNHFLSRFRQHGQREVQKAELHQLGQNLVELGDVDLNDLHQLIDYYDTFWLEEKNLEEKRFAYLRGSKDSLLNATSYLPDTKIFCISATLTISKKVSLADLLGFEQVTLDLIPTQTVTNQQLLFPTHLPDILAWTKEEHAAYLATTLGEMAELGRPILVLFTSISLLLQVSDLLEDNNIPHLAQHKHGQEMTLKRKFERGECQILLGTGVFWEGVDFASQDQLIQVITRLPFDNPKDRFVQKINHHLREEGKNPFYDYSLPMMMIKLKQAIGRTNRHDKQDSLVLVLDPRVHTKRYGRQILSFFEKDYQVLQPSESEMVAIVQEFLNK
ncbi:TPA: bifunctional DnaQ family exonuclease/ATP-dependent helicase [Streptococcus suis]|nr:bifunctional DnaQ family exonuclease/ATP-dependent helicase [Streptococcus suis]HEM3428095.1 bifunctional DnaQ family exonuclease/ATP-dependent helicase [Streptococcus suis]HEM3450628.1 bifunctional DnaQ family exonuclease/ATP-dependent helicase [Streptococcus suis]HEM3461653.1 bifunctional DnaQ family exonuclease/ATP-dependent helicase [Streptococcus suis]HEM3498249.1 bifunctional DnaQ family exonuclease/ATP-dependent helicase [Streptococcus suis]